MGNTIGHTFCFTSFGESHGAAVGGIIDGCPAGLHLDMQAIQIDLQRRKTAAIGGSPRAAVEPDTVEWLSGLKDGVTLGTPIAFLIRNTAHHTAEYNPLQGVFRPAHADYTYWMKYGIRDTAGGGRASARETVARVVAGSIAKQLLRENGIEIAAKVLQVGDETDPQRIETLLKEVQQAGDSIGGIVGCTITGLPAGVGEPIFDKLQARLAYAMLSINACKGFDYGSGFQQVGKRGSYLNDKMPYTTNHAGGILGGISNGQDIYFRCVFKPTPSIALPQETVDENGEKRTIQVRGRHDVCVALRAPVIVEAMTALTIADLIL